MKTERRHELQENELAGWLGQKISKIMPYSRTILGVLVLAAVTAVATGYIRGRNEQAVQRGWSAYFDAMSTSDAATFEDVADRFSGTTAGEWALQRAGDLRLDDALRQMFQNREAAQQDLQAAREDYERLISGSSDHMIRQRAIYGLAKCLESQGQFDEARKRYDEIISGWSDTQFADLARQRVKKLEQPATKQWYTWFAEQKPVTSPLTDPSMFQDLPNLPDSPDLQMPNPGQLLTPDAADDDPSDDLSGDGTSVTEPTNDSPLGLDLNGAISDDSGEGVDSKEPVTLDLDLDLDDTPAADEADPVDRLEIELPGSDADANSDSNSGVGLDLDLDLDLDTGTDAADES